MGKLYSITPIGESLARQSRGSELSARMLRYIKRNGGHCSDEVLADIFNVGKDEIHAAGNDLIRARAVTC